MHATYFADQLRVMAALDDTAATDRVLDAFQKVPREAFTGPGPWKLRSSLVDLSLPPQQTPNADPRWLYHCVLVVLDEEKGINIGDPALWVRLLTQADIAPGSRILQVGAGVGYYTAILSVLAGAKGKVTAYEVEAALAERAASNLTDWGNIEVRHGNAATDLNDTEVFDFVVSFAGVTHVPTAWATRLAPNARLLLPLTGANWWGAMILAQQSDQGFDAVTLGRCGFYPCDGARSDALAAQVTSLFSKPAHLNGWRFRMRHDSGDIRFEARTG
ncbi:MAG: methyltransferase domain-containing protein [Pseudomonadota bacterium]